MSQAEPSQVHILCMGSTVNRAYNRKCSGMQAVWRFILWPALFVSVGYTVIKNPDAAVDFVTSIILFSASQPALTSIAILFVFGLVITPYVLPVALVAFVLLVMLQPSAIKSVLPAPPPIPKWLLPSPVRQVPSPFIHTHVTCLAGAVLVLVLVLLWLGCCCMLYCSSPCPGL